MKMQKKYFVGNKSVPNQPLPDLWNLYIYTLTEILYVWWNVAVSWARRFDNRSKALLEIFIGSTWIFQSLIHHCFGTRSETQHSKHHETNPKHLHDLIHHTEQKPEIVASTCPILLHYSTCSCQFRIHILLNENWQNFWPPWAKKAPTSWRYHITWRQWCWRGPILGNWFFFSSLNSQHFATWQLQARSAITIKSRNLFLRLVSIPLILCTLRLRPIAK